MVLEDVGRDRRGLVAQARLELGPGVEVRDEPYRDYPYGTLAAHLVGYMNQPSSKELVELEQQGYDPSEFIGRYGIEKEWEQYLHGKKGIERFIINAKRRAGRRPVEAEDLIEGPQFEPPVAGHDVVLTIDLELQRLAEKAVEQPGGRRGRGGRGRHRPHPGAGAPRPSFDPNVMTGHLTRAEDDRMKADPRRPYVDKTLQQHYPPGSTYKFVVAGAALEDGVASPHERLGCPASYKVGRPHLPLPAASTASSTCSTPSSARCNIYFWKLSERVGIDRMAEVARDFGFGAPTGLGLNGDVPGRVPTKAFYEKRGFQVGHTLNAATGQGDDEVTVLQLAMAYAAMANGGRLYAPQLVAAGGGGERRGGRRVPAGPAPPRSSCRPPPSTSCARACGGWSTRRAAPRYEGGRSDAGRDRRQDRHRPGAQRPPVGAATRRARLAPDPRTTPGSPAGRRPSSRRSRSWC